MNSIRYFRPQSSILTLLFGALVALVCLQTASNAQQNQPSLTLGGTLLTTCNEHVSKIVPLRDGKLLVIGDFTEIGGYTCNGFARLNADGTVDADFVCELDSKPKCVAVQPDGKILVGGRFYEIGGYRGPQPKLVRLHPDGRIDSSFKKLDLLGRVNCVGVQLDGKILVGGLIYSIAGMDVGNLARLHPDGSVDKTFQNRVATLKGHRLASVNESSFEWKTATSDLVAEGWPDLKGLGEGFRFDYEINAEVASDYGFGKLPEPVGLGPGSTQADINRYFEAKKMWERQPESRMPISGLQIETQAVEQAGSVVLSGRNEYRGGGYWIIRAKKRLQRRVPEQ